MKIRTGRYGHRRTSRDAEDREAVGPDVRLLTDGNGAFTLPQAVKFGQELEKLDFYMFEEPLATGPQNYGGYDVLTKTWTSAVAGRGSPRRRAPGPDHIISVVRHHPAGRLAVRRIGECCSSRDGPSVSIQALPHCGPVRTIAATSRSSRRFRALPRSKTGERTMNGVRRLREPVPRQDRTKIRVEKGYFDGAHRPGSGIEIDDVVKRYVKNSPPRHHPDRQQGFSLLARRAGY